MANIVINNIRRERYAFKFNDDYLADITKNVAAQRNDWTQEEIKALLKSNDRFVLNSLLKLYARQTEDEKETESTSYKNGRGFNGCDAKVLCNIAKQCFEEHFISFKQIAYVRSKICKYSKQLMNIANGKA